MKKSKFLTKFFAGRVPLLLTLIVVTLIITAIVMPKAFNRGNAQQIMNNLCFACIFGIGVPMLLMGGGFDFAASAHSTVATLVFLRVLQSNPNMPWGVAALAAILFGAFAGGVNAYLAHGLKLMPFIATIGMSNVWGGIAKWATKGNYVAINDPGFLKLTTARIGNTPIPVLLIFVIMLVVIYSLVLKYTKFGRSVAMVGGNPEAARLAGINPAKIKCILYINNGVLAAIGGLIWSSQQRMYNPSGLTTLAPEMTSLTAAILGGISFMGGSGSLGGAFCGVVLISLLGYALQAMNLPTWVTTLVNGMLLVLALTIDGLTRRKGRKKMASSRMLMPGMSR
jgi:ribose/xylose/arabinose/galactoside ABC-type transport system permease subunit